MTEQEAETLVKGLTQIWSPLEVINWSVKDEGFFFYCQVAEGMTLSFFQDGSYVSLDEEHTYAAIEYRRGELHPVCTAPSDSTPEEMDECFEGVDKFAAQWLEVFRRNCWLSGLAVEASAHEKAEWMQGFTREEVEAWNFKL